MASPQNTHLTTYSDFTIIDMMRASEKRLIWVGSSKKDYLELPDAVQDVFGYALHVVQSGGKPRTAKPLKGFKSGGILELVDDHARDTFRAVYTVRFATAVYVLHAFQKKAKKGIATPQADIDLIRQRLRDAEAIHRYYEQEEKSHEPGNPTP